MSVFCLPSVIIKLMMQFYLYLILISTYSKANISYLAAMLRWILVHNNGLCFLRLHDVTFKNISMIYAEIINILFFKQLNIRL